MILTKKNMFGGDDGGETNIFYQWKGSYTLEQMSDEVLKVENFLDANRKNYHVTQIYSWYSEQGDAGTRVTFDTKEAGKTKPLIEAIAQRAAQIRARRRSASATTAVARAAASPARTCRCNWSAIRPRRWPSWARTSCRSWPSARELRDVRVDSGDQNSELSVRVDRERAAAFGFSAQEVAQFVGIALRGAPLREFRRGETEVPVWVRFAGAERFTASRTSPASRCARRTDAPCRC